MEWKIANSPFLLMFRFIKRALCSVFKMKVFVFTWINTMLEEAVNCVENLRHEDFSVESHVAVTFIK